MQIEENLNNPTIYAVKLDYKKGEEYNHIYMRTVKSLLKLQFTHAGGFRLHALTQGRLEACADYSTFNHQAQHSLWKRTYSKVSGNIIARMPVENHGITTFEVDVIRADIPQLLGFRELEKKGLLLNCIQDQLEHTRLYYSLLVTYKNGHSFVDWSTNNIPFM